MSGGPDATVVERARVQVCLVSAQATPNLTPLLDPAFAPRRVVMVVSPDMRERARWLAEVVRPRGIAVEEIAVPDAWDMHDVCDRLVEWLDAQGADLPVALNVTGGTKPMAMAAQQAFAMAGLPVFYVHQERDEVLWLTPRHAPVPLKGGLKLEPYLHAHGWQVLERPPLPQVTPALRQLTGELVLQVGSLEQVLGRLNWYAHQCDVQRSLEVELDARDLSHPGFTALLDKFEAAGACALAGRRLRFPDEAARFFCNGGWLEVHVAAVLGDIRVRAGVQDLAAGLKVRSLDNRLRGDAGSNELDVAFLARNRLHIVECKTRSFRERHSAAEAVYKLDALSALGGLNTRGMLVSYRPLSDGDRQRAADLRIRTVVGSAVANLRDELLRWIGGKGQ
jgi:hypothetical protein